ncbi:3899_t:CDS:2 [Dentiscutata erythropus]|uniref:3899_t:CDS:1 n=1 Tax=Dentiscutata erythropus TaxID=1348616 RepID=A0A9N9NA36_9GLOM|nr:3899_t:CDS:2 [Dentiscutata erythropus]
MSSKKFKETKTILTNKQRKDIIKHKEKNPQISQADLVSWVKQTMGLMVHQTTISRLIKNKEEIRKNPVAKRQKTVQHPVTNRFTCNTQPDTTLATVRLKGKKINKERLTLALCANADGTDKMMPFVIVLLFQKWLKKFDLKMAGRNVILLMDNAKVHSWLLDQYESEKDNKMDVLTAIKFIVRGWREVSSETIKNCFRHTGILPLVQDNNEEPTTYNNDDDIMEELYNNIELLNLQNVMDLEDYIDYSEERIVTGIMSDQEILNQATYQEPQQVESDEEDDSVETPQITHKEALDAIHRLELYLMQQDLNYVVQTENDVALSKLYELVRKIRNASFKQLNIETFFEPVGNDDQQNDDNYSFE